MTQADETRARVQARVDRALARAALAPGMTFAEVVRAVAAVAEELEAERRGRVLRRAP